MIIHTPYDDRFKLINRLSLLGYKMGKDYEIIEHNDCISTSNSS